MSSRSTIARLRRTRTRHRPTAVVVGAAVLALTLLTAACGGSTSPSGAGSATGGSDPKPSPTAAVSSAATGAAVTPTQGGSLTFAVANDPINLNPSAIGSGNDTLYVTRQLFDSLTEQDPRTGEVVPWLAQQFSASDDARTFTFTLRPGVTFSDGTPLTAQSVKATFDDIAANGANAGAAAPFLAGYQGTEVTGDLTFTVTFSQPNGGFLQAVSTVALAPVAAATLAVPYDQRGSGAALVGTGPFTLDHYTKDSEVVLQRRDAYAWGPQTREHPGAAYLDRVVFRIVPESGVRIGSLDSGQVQVIGGVAPQDIDGLAGKGHSVVERPNPGIAFGLSANIERPLVQDVRVRQALAKAINATDVRDAALNEHFAVATSPLAANTPGWTDLSGELTSDPAAAAALLDEAGWVPGADGVREKDGQRLHLVIAYITNFGPNQTALELIQQQLADVGVETELWTGTVPEYRSALQDGRADLAWGNLSRADGDVLRVQFATQGSNWFKLDDPDLQAALTAQQASADPATRAAAQQTAQRILVEKGYQIPVHELTTVLGTQPSVHGVTLGADSRLSQLTDAFVAG